MVYVKTSYIRPGSPSTRILCTPYILPCKRVSTLALLVKKLAWSFARRGGVRSSSAAAPSAEAQARGSRYISIIIMIAIITEILIRVIIAINVGEVGLRDHICYGFWDLIPGS